MKRSEKKLLLTGAGGQLGQAFLRLFATTPGGVGEVVATDLGVPASPHLELDEQDKARFIPCDLSNPSDITALLDEVRPDLILNPAAYTAVDQAEQEAELAHRINATAPGILAEWAARHGAMMVHYSTDYVFDGAGDAPRKEGDPTGPLGVYGQTKLAGEQAVQAAGARGAIFRTSWVYSDHGHNFVKTMLKLATERDELRVVADQIGAPTSAHFLARMSWHAAVQMTSAGNGGCEVYHLVPRGWVSWHGFAEAIFARAREVKTTEVEKPLRIQRVVPIATSEYPTPAQRPLNSRLDVTKFEQEFAVQLPPWEDGLDEVLGVLTTGERPNASV